MKCLNGKKLVGIRVNQSAKVAFTVQVLVLVWKGKDGILGRHGSSCNIHLWLEPPMIVQGSSTMGRFSLLLSLVKNLLLDLGAKKKGGGNRHEDMTTFKSVHNATGSVHIKSFSKIVFNSRLFWYPSQSDIFRKCRRSSRASVGYAALSLSSTLEVNQTSQSQLARNMADHNTVGLAGDSLLLWYYSSTCLIFLCYDKWNKVIPDPSHRRLGMIE